MKFAPLALGAVLAINPALLVAQAVSPAPVIHGTVRDSVQHPIAGVEIFLADTAGRRVATTTSSAAGRFTLRAVARSESYRVTFRKIGYHPATITVRPLAAGDTAAFHVVLAEAVAVLPDVAVRAEAERRPYSVDSLTIAARPNRDALDVVVRYPWMLGDGAKECLVDPSGLTVGAARRIPRGLRPLSEGGQPFRLFVNGQLQIPDRVKDVLASIPADSIAELHYVGCWDEERPSLCNSLSVVLKPSRAR